MRIPIASMACRTSPTGFAKLLLLLSFCLASAAPLRGAIRDADPGRDFFTDKAPVRFEISVSTNDFAALNNRTRDYVPVLVKIGTNAPAHAGFRLRGFSSFQKMDRKPAFALKLSESLSRKCMGGLSKLLFNNCVNDQCCMREHLACALFRTAGVSAARTRLVCVSINNRDLGVFLAIEAMNKDFLRHNFGNDSGNLYEGRLHDIDRELELDNGTDTSRRDVQQLFAAAREPDLGQRWDKLNRILDVDQFMMFAAMQVLLGHADGYLQNRNNYRIYHDPASGKMNFIPHGLDTSFIRGGDMTPPTNSIVMRALYSIPEARKRYIAACGFLITNTWQVPTLTNEIHRMGALAKLYKGPAEYQRFQDCEDFLISQILGRQQEVLAWLSEPEPKVLPLLPGEAVSLTDWSPFIRSGSPLLFILTNTDGIYLRIDARQPAAAGWRSRAIVAEGDYLFSCRVRAEVPPGPSLGQMPALLLRLAGDLGGAALTRYGEWEPLSFRFVAPPDGRTAEFLSELQAGSGDIWVDMQSIRITRNK